MELDFVRIEYDIIADSPALLVAPLYDSLRNFESFFKLSSCHDALRACVSCSKQSECPYRMVFAQALSSDPEVVRIHQKPSLPFSLYIGDMNATVSSIAIGIVVVGSAVNYLVQFQKTLLRLVESAIDTYAPSTKASCHLYSLDYLGVRHAVASAALLPESVILLSGRHILQSTMHTDTVRVIIKSPLRLLINGSTLHRFDFASFFRAQLRRCSSLLAYYGSGKLDLDFVSLSDLSQNVAVIENKMLYTQPPWSKRLNRAGMCGSAECVGLVEPMISLLLLGSYFNAGKGASFGSGFYQIEVM